MFVFLDNIYKPLFIHESSSLIIFYTLIRSSISCLVDFGLSNDDKSVIFKFFDFLSPKSSCFWLIIRVRIMNLLRLLFGFFWCIFRLVLLLFITLFSLLIVSFIFSSFVIFWAISLVSNFSIIVWSLRPLTSNFILDWSNSLTIVSFCFT